MTPVAAYIVQPAYGMMYFKLASENSHFNKKDLEQLYDLVFRLKRKIGYKLMFRLRWAL